MSPLNVACFGQPHWKIIARGLKTEEWFDDGQAVGTGGILMPEKADLRVGSRYYRFASSTSPREAQLGGGWWIDFESYHAIEAFAKKNDYDLGYAARLFLSLPYSWTRVDRLVNAILEVPLLAYAGRGNRAVEKGDSWTPIQHKPVTQLYIPGLFTKGLKPGDQLYQRAFPNPTIEFVATKL